MSGKYVYVYAMGYQKEILTHAPTCIRLEDFLLSYSKTDMV